MIDRKAFESLLATFINFLAVVLFGMLGVGAAPLFIATTGSLGYGVLTTVFPFGLLVNGINKSLAK